MIKIDSPTLMHTVTKASYVEVAIIALCFALFSVPVVYANSPGGGGGIGDPPPPSDGEQGGGSAGGGEGGVGEGDDTDTNPPTSGGGASGGGGEINDEPPPDTTAPTIIEALIAPVMFFADGVQTVTITSTTSEEANIELWITNIEDEPVFEETWEEVESFNVRWNGLTGENIPLPNGTYTVWVTLTDEAGNTQTIELGSVTIISVRGLLEEAYAELTSADDRSTTNERQMLRTVLFDHNWVDQNTLSPRSVQSVTRRLDNAIKFLEQGTYEEVFDKVLTARAYVGE